LPDSDAGVTAPRLAAAVAALFDVPVTAAEIDGPVVADPERLRRLLHEAEWLAIRHCHAKRIRDFVAGRLCARRALHALGVRSVAILPGEDRLPRWPALLVGSITHTEGYCAAVVAQAESVSSLGLDAERIDRVRTPLWPRFCSPLEMQRLSRMEEARRACAATLAFTAKEAFFKCQFPLTREWLGFHAVAIGFEDPVGESGEFRIEPQQPLRLAAHLARSGAGGAAGPGIVLKGRYRQQGGIVTAAMALLADGAAPLV
jgi:4'-phosphopantetheinyl transferase EntD